MPITGFVIGSERNHSISSAVMCSRVHRTACAAAGWKGMKIMGTESYTYYDSYRFDKRPMDVIQKEKLLRRLSPFVWSKTKDVISELRGMLEGYTDYQRLCLLYRIFSLFGILLNQPLQQLLFYLQNRHRVAVFF